MKSVGKISVIVMNAQKYKQILQENLMSSVESLELPSDYIFQQDNDPKQLAKSTKKWLSENNVLQWPSQSPNLNPIGNLWRFLKIQIRKQYARKNSTKYLLIVARNLLRTTGRA